MQIFKDNPELYQKLLTILASKNQSLKKLYAENILDFQPDLFPLKIKQWFPGYKHYLLELGSGWGDFSIEYAKLHPDTLCIALDKKKYRIKKSAKEQIALGLINIQWLICNFDWMFQGLFQPDTFDKIIINFPDPWPKKRHQKNRFIRPDFIKELSLVSRSEALLEFATDNWKYMEDVIHDFHGCGEWKNIHGENIILPFLENRPISFFENLKRQEKENIYFIQIKKSDP